MRRRIFIHPRETSIHPSIPSHCLCVSSSSSSSEFMAVRQTHRESNAETSNKLQPFRHLHLHKQAVQCGLQFLTSELASLGPFSLSQCRYPQAGLCASFSFLCTTDTCPCSSRSWGHAVAMWRGDSCDCFCFWGFASCCVQCLFFFTKFCISGSGAAVTVGSPIGSCDEGPSPLFSYQEDSAIGLVIFVDL